MRAGGAETIPCDSRKSILRRLVQCRFLLQKLVQSRATGPDCVEEEIKIFLLVGDTHTTCEVQLMNGTTRGLSKVDCAVRQEIFVGKISRVGVTFFKEVVNSVMMMMTMMLIKTFLSVL